MRLPLLVSLTLMLTFFLSIEQSIAQSKKRLPVAKKKSVSLKIAPLPAKQSGTKVLIITDSGNMVIRLYDSTPLHRDNFVNKIKEGFYDSLLFHRVIANFMLQGGDPNSKYALSGQTLGFGSAPGDRIPAEFRPYLFHKKGALAAARDGNPEKASSNCQFYLVQGKKYTDQELAILEIQTGNKLTDAQRLAYKTLGGTPFLDQGYTVFGETEIGVSVIDKIAKAATQPGDRPVADIRMSMKVISEEEFEKLWLLENKPKVAAKKKAVPLQKNKKKVNNNLKNLHEPLHLKSKNKMNTK